VSESSRRILTINTGSSSLRAGLYDVGQDEHLLVSAEADRLGTAEGQLQIADAEGRSPGGEPVPVHDHAEALRAFVDWLRERASDRAPDAVAHRVVHGGREFTEPRRIDDALMAALARLVQVAPDHLPQAIAAIRAAGEAFPQLTQVACFDTAFHRRMPLVAQRYPLPRELEADGVVRYGFHGLSYEFVLRELRRLAPAEASGSVIIAHLGNGASMAAVRDGVSVDTTMGFSPTGGLMMGTRSGDLDPGVLLYLLQAEGQTAGTLNMLLNHQAGLLGVSGSSADMRTLLEHEKDSPRAAAAVELFCYTARKYLGALCAVLGGIETLVFTAGIGEHAAPVRSRICAGLEFLGLRLDTARNNAHAPVISSDDSRVTVRVIQTDENRMIARHAYHLLYA